MFIGAIRFWGRLGRRGWWVTLILAGVGALLALAVVIEVVEKPPRPSVAVQDAVVYAAIAFWVLAGLTVISASVRRLRDAGSGMPFLELLLGATIPMFGWLWLLYRLPFAGSAGRKQVKPPVEATEQARRQMIARMLQAVPDAGRPRRAPGKAQNKERIVHDTHVHDVRETHTVTRVRRLLGPRARRNIGF